MNIMLNVGQIDRIVCAFSPLIIDTSLKTVLKEELILDCIMIGTKHRYLIDLSTYGQCHSQQVIDIFLLRLNNIIEEAIWRFTKILKIEMQRNIKFKQWELGHLMSENKRSEGLQNQAPLKDITYNSTGRARPSTLPCRCEWPWSSCK